MTATRRPTKPLTQRIIFWVYVVGLIVMALYNIGCYPGTWVGKIGWAIVWPLTLLGYITELLFRPDALAWATSCSIAF